MLFHAEEWAFLDDHLRPDESGAWCPMPSIVGPIDVRYAIRIRKLLEDYIDVKRSCLMDVFVLSIGEPPQRDITKIGGIPYLSRRRKWPLSNSGVPLPFLAQFDFRESHDIVDGLAGNLLLVFGNLGGEDGFKLLWQDCGIAEGELVNAKDIPNNLEFIPLFWGKRWRVENYAEYESDERLDDISYKLNDGSSVQMFQFAMQLAGMTIGRCPFILNGSDVKQNGEKILCTLTMIAPALHSPFPFINIPDQITKHDISVNKLNLASLPDADFFGLLYILQDSQNNLKIRFTTL